MKIKRQRQEWLAKILPLDAQLKQLFISQAYLLVSQVQSVQSNGCFTTCNPNGNISQLYGSNQIQKNGQSQNIHQSKTNQPSQDFNQSQRNQSGAYQSPLNQYAYKNSSPKHHASLLRSFTYSSKELADAKLSSFISVTSQSLLYLQIRSHKIVFNSQIQKYQLFLQIQQPLMSFKEKLMSKIRENKSFSQKELIQLVNCLQKIIETLANQSLTATSQQQPFIKLINPKSLGDCLFYTYDHQIKISHLVYPDRIRQKATLNSQQKNSLVQQVTMNLAVLLIQALTLHDKTEIYDKNTIDNKLLERLIWSLKFETFCMRQLRQWILDKMTRSISKMDRKTGQQRRLNQLKKIGPKIDGAPLSSLLNKKIQKPFKKNIENQKIDIICPSKQPLYPSIGCLLSSSKVHSNLQKSNSSFWNQKQNASNPLEADRIKNIQQQLSSENHKYLGKKFTSLYQIAQKQCVQSFQDDEYSYILQSNSSSPNRHSPSRTFGLFQHLVSMDRQTVRPARLSFNISEDANEEMSQSDEINLELSDQQEEKHSAGKRWTEIPRKDSEMGAKQISKFKEYADISLVLPPPLTKPWQENSFEQIDRSNFNQQQTEKTKQSGCKFPYASAIDQVEQQNSNPASQQTIPSIDSPKLRTFPQLLTKNSLLIHTTQPSRYHCSFVPKYQILPILQQSKKNSSPLQLFQQKHNQDSVMEDSNDLVDLSESGDNFQSVFYQKDSRAIQVRKQEGVMQNQRQEQTQMQRNQQNYQQCYGQDQSQHRTSLNQHQIEAKIGNIEHQQSLSLINQLQHSDQDNQNSKISTANPQYTGQLLNGLKHGKGKLAYPDGGYYYGLFSNNLIQGFGRLYYPSNKLAYSGYWLNDCFHGPGLLLNQQIQQMIASQNSPPIYMDLSLIKKSWVSFKGNFELDIRAGYGTIKLQNGDVISGTWRGNKLNGEGTYRRATDGWVLRGKWRQDRMVEVIEEKLNHQEHKNMNT